MKQVVSRKGVWFITQKTSWHYLVRFKHGQHKQWCWGKDHQVFVGHLLCGYYSILKREFNTFDKGLVMQYRNLSTISLIFCVFVIFSLLKLAFSMRNLKRKSFARNSQVLLVGCCLLG